MQRIKPSKCFAVSFNLVVADAIGCVEFQVLGHPYLVADSRVLINLAIAGIGKGATVRFSVGVHTVCRANHRRIEGVNGLIRSGGTAVETGGKQCG